MGNSHPLKRHKCLFKQTLIIIYYLEDPDVNITDITEIETAAAKYEYEIISEIIRTNSEPQTWDTFTEIHNFGLLLSK